MRTGTLKRKTGCQRCKRRHKRCDELKPKCSYCARWQLECIWPVTRSPEPRILTTTPSQTSGGPKELDPETNRVRYTSLTGTNDNRPGLHPLHSLPPRNFGESSTGSKWVQEFFVANTSATYTYDAAELYSEIVRGWPRFAFLDKAACAAQVASWAGSSVQRRKDSKRMISGPKFETLTISHLRHAVSPGAPVSEEVLLATTVYLIISAGDFFDISQLHDMIEGVNTMVASFGGIDVVLQEMRASTMLAVLHCDIFGSLLNVQHHLFVQVEKPHRPQTLTEAYRAQPSDMNILRHVAADVVEVFDELGILLYFRQSSNRTRAFSEDESRHLLLLSPWIDYRLGVLQKRHLKDASLSELIVVALIILKQEMIADAVKHSILVSTLLTRLQVSISHFPMRASSSEPGSELIQTLTMWTSLITLVGNPLTLQKLWFADYIHNGLTYRYGPIQDWPESWEEDLRTELQQVLWHERIATSYGSLCSEIRGHRQARGFT